MVKPSLWPLPNVWLGTSVENQATADERIPHLLRVPAAVRFLSVEPLLGSVNLIGGELGEQPFLRAINWVIVGGESGPKARPCNIAWIRSIVEQCKAAKVPVFVKQLGSKPIASDDETAAMMRSRSGGWQCAGDGHGNFYWQLTDRKGGDMTEWPQDLRVREFPAVLS